MRSPLGSRTGVSGAGSSIWTHMTCTTSGMEACGVSDVKSKNAMQDSTCGPVTSLNWFGAQLVVSDSVLLAFAKTLSACNDFVLGQPGASRSCSLA